MSPPEDVRGRGIGNKKPVKDESAQVWNNAAKESTRTRGIDFFRMKIIVELKLECM